MADLGAEHKSVSVYRFAGGPPSSGRQFCLSHIHIRFLNCMFV